MILTFVYPICTGLIDASERLEASAQRVLRGVQYSSSKTSSKCNHTGQSRFRTAAAAAAAGDGLQCVWNKLPWCTECVRSAWQEAVQREQQWLQPLMRLLLVQPGLQAMRQVVMVGVPSVLSSRQSGLLGLVCSGYTLERISAALRCCAAAEMCSLDCLELGEGCSETLSCLLL